MDKVIDFAPNGTVSSLHQDAFSLGFLGNQHIERATDITFNEATQKWNIRVLGPREWSASYLSGFDEYDEARRFEVAWINICMFVGADWKAGDEASRQFAENLRRGRDGAAE